MQQTPPKLSWPEIILLALIPLGFVLAAGSGPFSGTPLPPTFGRITLILAFTSCNPTNLLRLIPQPPAELLPTPDKGEDHQIRCPALSSLTTLTSPGIHAKIQPPPTLLSFLPEPTFPSRSLPTMPTAVAVWPEVASIPLKKRRLPV
jgi:hypothetical protein